MNPALLLTYLTAFGVNGGGGGGGASVTTVLQKEGFVFYTACVVGTTANLNATYNNGTAGVGATLTNAGTLAAFTTDGVSPLIGSRILVKNQSVPSHNGIYVLTTVGSASVAWILTRATDFDTSGKITVNQLIRIESGSTLNETYWRVSQAPTVIGTDSISFQLLNFFDIFATLIEGGMVWEDARGLTQTMVSNTGYFAKNASLLEFTTPAAPEQGDEIAVIGVGAGDWAIFPGAAGHRIHIGTDECTPTTGSFSSTSQYDTVHLIWDENTVTWRSLSFTGFIEADVL